LAPRLAFVLAMLSGTWLARRLQTSVALFNNFKVSS